MAKGYDRDRDRKNLVSSFGKDLVKRSKSKCELCEKNGVKLSVYEILPVKEEPDFDRTIFICDECIKSLENIKKTKDSELRYLTNSVWSEVVPVKALSIYVLKNIEERTPWARDILEDLYVDEETDEYLKTIDF